MDMQRANKIDKLVTVLDSKYPEWRTGIICNQAELIVDRCGVAWSTLRDVAAVNGLKLVVTHSTGDFSFQVK